MKSLRWCLSLVLLASAASARAQGILIPAAFYPVQNAPFSLTIETLVEPANGDPPKHGAQRILRDSAGRQRYESPVMEGAPESSTVGIYDVVSGKYIKLDFAARTAVVAPMQVGRTVVLDVSTATSLPPANPADGQTLLGIREIAGFEAWGQRTLTTKTLTDGSTMTQDRELWLSTHYRLPVLQIMRRPQGKTTQTISSFSSDEPDPALFKIPPGFTVSDAPPEPGSEPGTVRIGGDVSPPIVLSTAEPQFSEQARRAKVGGDVLLHLIVDENGLPQKVRVIRGIGMGLDEKALEAVKQYRFKPAMRQGTPVKVEMNIQVSFQIFTKP